MHRRLDTRHLNSWFRIIASFSRRSFHILMKRQAGGLCDPGRPQHKTKGTAMTGTTSQRDAERIYQMWDDALGRKDLEASLSLYADDASIESPLVRHLMGTRESIVQGKAALRAFITKVFKTNPPQRRRFKQGFFTDGRVLTWEYPRATPDGDQMDLVEVMEIEDGLIRRHRVYWGWYGLNVLRDGHQ